MLRWLLRIWRPLPGPLKLAYLRLRYGWYGVGVAALIRDENGRVLVAHRTYSDDEPWALPGGEAILFTVPDGHATNLDTFVEVHRQSVRLTMPIDDIDDIDDIDTADLVSCAVSSCDKW